MSKQNPITEFYDEPTKWALDRDRYDWLSDQEVAQLERYPFDWGDILLEMHYFPTDQQLANSLCARITDVDMYCRTIWRKPWDMVREVLKQCARKETFDVLSAWAKRGNATAIAALSRMASAEEQALRDTKKVSIVNDLDDEE